MFTFFSFLPPSRDPKSALLGRQRLRVPAARDRPVEKSANCKVLRGSVRETANVSRVVNLDLSLGLVLVSAGAEGERSDRTAEGDRRADASQGAAHPGQPFDGVTAGNR